MKKREVTELHTKTETELRELMKELLSSLASARLDQAQQKLTNTRSLTNLRKDIARVLTVLRTKMKTSELAKEGGKTA